MFSALKVKSKGIGGSFARSGVVES